jgi:hypothetical protein
MQLSTVFVTFFLGCIFFFNNGGSCQNIALPIQACVSAISSGNYAACTNDLATQIYKLHHWGTGRPDTTCGFPCTDNVKGRFSRWEWKWDAQFQCDSTAPGIIGMATKKSSKGAKEWAIKDFVNKAIAAGHIKAEDVKC